MNQNSKERVPTNPILKIQAIQNEHRISDQEMRISFLVMKEIF
jgi:hypothetical protein